MLPFQLDPHSDIPVTVQIREQIRYQICTGLLPPGTQLPSLRDLAQQLGINRNTVVAALQDLERQGLVRTQQGRGVFVAPDPPRLAAGLPALVAGALEQAAAMGVAARDFALAALAHSQLVAPARRPRVLAVAGTRDRAAALKEQLEAALPVAAWPVLSDELAAALRAGPWPDLPRAAAVTALHAPAARLALGDRVPVLAVGAACAQALAQVLAAPPPALTVHAPDWVHAARIRQSLAAAGFPDERMHLAVRPGPPGLEWEGGALTEPLTLAPGEAEAIRHLLDAPAPDRRRGVSPWI